MEITEDLNLQMKNVLSYRGKVDQKTLEEKRKEIEDLIKEFHLIRMYLMKFLKRIFPDTVSNLFSFLPMP